MVWELLPVSEGGYTLMKSGIVDCRKNGKPASVQFLNQGVRSMVTINIGGTSIDLLPGAAYTFVAPTGGYLISTYDVKMITIAGTGTPKNNCKVIIQKYIEPS